jgi:hypothetical protein
MSKMRNDDPTSEAGDNLLYSRHHEDMLHNLDPGIRREVEILQGAGVETFESCQGGTGHAFFEPTVRFCGQHSEGFKALAVALQHGLRVSELRRYYSIQDGEPVGPQWEMTFRTANAASD